MSADEQQQGSGRLVTRQQLDHEFALMLVKTIEAVQHDPAQFRNCIYEMARVQLQREAWHRNPPMNILELRRMMLALETAIERVESDASQRDALPALAPHISMVGLDEAPAARDAVMLVDQPHAREPAAIARMLATTGVPEPLKAVLRFGVLAALAAVTVIVLDREFHVLSPAPPAVVDAAPATPPPHVAAAPPAQSPGPFPAGPVPAVYGIYAVSGSKLYELEPLAGRAPDLRMFMSAVIKTPSRTVLPDGDVSFVVYRRDIASSAPDRASVRVIAKVARAMTFTKPGQPVTTNVDGEWAVRNVTFDYRIAPSPDSPEMILIKPAVGAASLTPGRYALAIKGQMFDFTVEGPITEAAHCLERTEAANGRFYSECRQVR
jgi:hypothetical protein